MKSLFFIILVTLLYPGAGFSGIELAEFDDPEQEKLYKVLVDELRCLVCQNQNLADSNAPLAKDLRNEVQKMIKQGNSQQQIIDFMVARYGDFVLYRPPFKAYTLVLWLGPFIGLIFAVYILINIIRSRNSQQVEAISADDQEKISALLKSGLSSDENTSENK